MLIFMNYLLQFSMIQSEMQLSLIIQSLYSASEATVIDMDRYIVGLL